MLWLFDLERGLRTSRFGIQKLLVAKFSLWRLELRFVLVICDMHSPLLTPLTNTNLLSLLFNQHPNQPAHATQVGAGWS